MPVRTLYVTDLDGTLLGPDGELEAGALHALNRLIEGGLMFSVATGRSYYTAERVMRPVRTALPLIIMNGAVGYDLAQKRRLFTHAIARPVAEEAVAVMRRFSECPLLYTHDAQDRQRIYYEREVNPLLSGHIADRTRRFDMRYEQVERYEDRMGEELFYINLLGERERLDAIRRALQGLPLNGHYYRDVYGGGYWLEVCAERATKAEGVGWLKRHAQADELVVFGDNLNDLDMFRAADRCYAVDNAMEEVKRAATGVIAGNAQQGVVRFLEQEALRLKSADRR